MPEKCGKCDIELVSKEVIAKCLVCKQSFHPACSSAGSASFSKSRAKTWKCDGCVSECGSNVSVKSNEGNEDKESILEAIRQVKIDINKNIDVMNKSVEGKFTEVISSVKALTDEMKIVQVSVSSLEAAQSKLEERCDRLQHENGELQEEVMELRLHLHDSEQHQRAANIEIVGLPVTENENIYTCLQYVAQAIGVSYDRNDVSIAHRLRLYSTKKHAHPPIIVQFISRSVRGEWLAAARSKKGLNAKEVSPDLPESKVYVNEHLTANNKMLLGRARRLQRENKLHFAGYFNGKVMIKPSATGDSIQVTTLYQLDKFDKKERK